ncbi:thiazole tautomerase (transcriptional regulator TenI) [Anoxybacillus tengchongensis]|uniref:Thiazole tautomerase (Transcriptional regulator TenI) n=1 Tax=Anoxybacillus tengchongensis TaxID=576944 RepID=A0A7X0D9F3_9BACL|nr:thiazole tautomerase TenI [Anoxybacillus tengchongensis]MBB6176583.1 thiazole tautomerase (transcriptional regulator TenI) [Anoxybacillus tengchongensis]
MKELHLISTGSQPIETFVHISSLVHSYVDYIHVREKHRAAKEIGMIVEKLLEASVPAQKIVINDRVDVAVVYGVGGVQLAYHSLSAKQIKERFPFLRVGQSVHTFAEAKQAENEGADYVIFGHIYETNCKEGIKPRGLTSLQELACSVHIPVVAIGGITPMHVRDVLTAGATGIAVMSTVYYADHPLSTVQLYRQQMGEDTWTF